VGSGRSTSSGPSARRYTSTWTPATVPVSTTVHAGPGPALARAAAARASGATSRAPAGGAGDAAGGGGTAGQRQGEQAASGAAQAMSPGRAWERLRGPARGAGSWGSNDGHGYG
jgi:hypothetical protein